MFAFTFDINRIYTVIDGVVTLLPCVFQLRHPLIPVVPAFSVDAFNSCLCRTHRSFLKHMSLLSPFPSAC